MASARRPDEPEARRFFLHVGLAKSGTTFLQDVLYASTDQLAAQGAAMVPPRPGGNLNLALNVAGLLREGDEPAVAGARERFSRQLRERAPTIGIFSQEVMAPAPVESIGELLDLLEGYEVHVVVTVRDPGRMLASSWQQSIQQRQTTSLDEFVDDIEHGRPGAWWFYAAQDLPAVVSRWSQWVPLDRVHVVVVPPSSGGPDDLLSRFCGVLGLDPGPLTLPSRHGNPALGNTQAELLRRVNVALGDRLSHVRDGYREVGKQWLAMKVLRRQSAERPRLPARLRPTVQRTCEQWQEFLAHSGVRVVGDPAELAVDDRVFAIDDAPTATDAELVEAAVDALADILEMRHEERRAARSRRPPAAASAPDPSAATQRLRRAVGGRVRRVVRRAAGG